MSNLTALEKSRLENLLRMSSGYVLDFTDRSLQEFVLDTTGKDIYDSAYDYESGSKANRLRAFWRKEPNHLVGKLLGEMLELIKTKNNGWKDDKFKECESIVRRLRQSAPLDDLSALEPNAVGRTFETLAQEVKHCIESNKPEVGIDRLHTFVVKYIRVLCEKRGVDPSPEKPLHSIFGEYVKALKRDGFLESEVSGRILKSTISILEAFNDVRNNKSLAHDNELLSYNEALLMFSNVASLVRFLSAIENRTGASPGPRTPTNDDFFF